MALAEEAGHWVRAARLADLRGDGAHSVAAEGVDLVALRIQGARGALKVFEGRCPHQGALLGEGELEGTTLVCRNHRWKFDTATGQRIGGRQCLKSVPAREQNGELFVDLSAIPRPRAADVAPPRRRQMKDLPGPRQLPFVGNALQLRPERVHLQLEEWHARYGSPFTINLAGTDVIVVSDPADTEPIQRARPNSYRRVTVIEQVANETSLAGVFSAEGEPWRAQRRLAMEALAQRHLRGFFPYLQRVAERLIVRWERAADAGTVLDMADELKRFTVDVTTQLVFGHDLDTVTKDDDHEDAIQAHLEVFFPALQRRLNAVIPYWRWFKLPRDRRLDRAIVAIRAFIGKRMAVARARLAEDPARGDAPENFLEAMLVARDADGRPFDDEVIYGNALTMLLAGEDTTAYTIAWAVHHLCDAPRATASLRAELTATLGTSSLPRDLEQTNLLAYATAVANEAMRLRPVAPANFYEALHDVVIADVAVPKGTNVIALFRPAVLEPARFDNPLTFLPERWIADLRTGPHDVGAHMPFGSGPRICPGRTLALVEMRLVLGALYQNFEVQRVGDGSDVKELTAFAMIPVGIRVRLRRRARPGA